MTDLTYQDVLSILKLIDTGTFAKAEIEFNGTRLRLERLQSVPTATAATAAPRPPIAAAAAATAPTTAPPQPATVGSPARQPVPEIAGGIAVLPPMDGVFYAAPSPGAPPFTGVGQTVAKGDQLGIVEVMKLFTPITAPCDGIVRAILVTNEEKIEKAQTLMIIVPSAVQGGTASS